MSVKILIADDQALVRAGFRMILDAEDDLDVIGEAPDGLQAVELTVADLGADAGDGALLPGGGHGLVGMRERMRVHGGEVDAGRRPGGGFAVRARLPLLGEEQAAA